jgi:hypothetical protein
LIAKHSEGRRRRDLRASILGGLAALLVAAAGVWFFVLRGPSPPEDRAAALVPADALVYLHASTDPGRGEDERLIELLSRFPSLVRLRDRLQQSIGAFEYGRDVRPWLGKEAGVALLDSGGPAANVLLLLSVEDEPKAQGQLKRAAGAAGGVEHRGVAVRRFGGVAAAFVGGFLAIGQEAAVKAAIDRAKGVGKSLGPAPEGLPDGRSVDVRMSADGVRRVLRPQAGLLGGIGALIDDPALRSVTLALSAEDRGARVHVHQAKRSAEGQAFVPELLDTVPEDAAAYVGLNGLEAAGTVLGAAGGAALLSRLQERLPTIDLERDVVGPLRGEVAISVTPALPIPIVTLVARTRDEARTREALSRLRGAIAELLVPAEGEAGGQVPTFEERKLGGVTAYALALAPDVELLYAVTGGRLIVSTTAAGIERVAADGDSLREDERFERGVNEVPERAEALVFLDLSQLLTLGDTVGLDPGPAFQTARDDLRRVRVITAVAEREGPDTTAELFLEIP